MKKKEEISKKNKKIWQEFINNPINLYDKDIQEKPIQEGKRFRYDLHGFSLSEEERTSVTLAILLHDIGHGPFSHALEHSFVEGINHENISSLFMFYRFNRIKYFFL